VVVAVVGGGGVEVERRVRGLEEGHPTDSGSGFKVGPGSTRRREHDGERGESAGPGLETAQ
jgi:hypothetical protein